jgi:hypothetical protein
MFAENLKEKATSACYFFESAIKKSKLSHAYLLCGSDDELKDELAIQLTKILNCKEKDENGTPCGHCVNCVWLAEKTHPELPIVLEPDLEKSKRGVILVKQVQNFLSKIQHKSSFYRVVLIKKAESEFLPAESANSLLKTIEEPNSNILFLLYAKDRELVLPTIASRCQTINLPSSFETTDYSSKEELALQIFTKKLNWFSASKIASQLSDDENPTVQALDSLVGICLQNCESSHSAVWLKRIDLIEKAKYRLKSFCSAKPVLEELVWSLSQ